MIWLHSIRDVAAELIGAVTATLYPLDAQVRVTETQEVPMAEAPKVIIPVELDFTEARKQLAEFCGHDTPQCVTSGMQIATEEGRPSHASDGQLLPNYHEDTRLVDIVAQFGYIEYKRGLNSSKPDNWAELTDITKNSWWRAAREQLKELNR